MEREGHWMFCRPLVRNLGGGLDEGGMGLIDAQQIACRGSSRGRERGPLREELDLLYRTRAHAKSLYH